MTKKKGFILEKIADMDNLRCADKEAQAGKTKKNRHIRRHNLRAEEDLTELRRMILELDFPPPGYESMEIRNGDKVRCIAKQKYMPWKILQQAIVRVVGEDIYKNLISDTFACVPGKGQHYGVERMKMMLRRYPEYKWFWKTDLKKFYLSVPHALTMATFERKYKDKKFLKLIEIAVLNYDSGEELLNILEYENERKKRLANRRRYKPTYRELCCEPG